MYVDHYHYYDSIKVAYSLAMKEGLAEPRDLHILLVRTENTGKSCLVSSYLDEVFIEGQAATKAIKIDVCKIYCNNWSRISPSDKTDFLHYQFVDQLREEAVKEIMSKKFMDNKVTSVPQSADSGNVSLPISTAPLNAGASCW